MIGYLGIAYNTLMIIGYALIISGILFFLENAGILDLHWNLVWPILLIGIGLYIVHALHRLQNSFESLVGGVVRKIGAALRR